MNQSLLQQAAMLKKTASASKLIFLSPNKTKMGLRRFCKESGISIEDVALLSWSEVYEKLFDDPSNYVENWDIAADSVVNFIFAKLKEEHEWDGDYSSITHFLFGGILAESFNNDVSKLNGLRASNKGMSFSTIRNNTLKGLIPFKLIGEFGIPTKHLVFDPCEMQYDGVGVCDKTLYTKYHGYTSKTQRFERCDSLQFFLSESQERNVRERSLDFVFGATVLAKSRAWIDEIITDLKTELPSESTKIFYTNKYKKIDEFISRSEYLGLVAKSKYTLIVRSYDQNSFSMYRVIESVFNGCVPLLHRDSNWTLLSDSFKNIDEEWLKSTLVVDGANDIKSKMNGFGEEERKAICEFLYSNLFNDEGLGLRLPEL